MTVPFRPGRAWLIARKDFAVFRRRKSILAAVVLFPVIAAVGLNVALRYVGARSGGIPAAILPGLLDSFLFFFVIAATTLPTAIAAYSLVGEKISRSLEPLLATPTSDGEILVGKTLAAILPTLAATFAGAILFMVLADLQTTAAIGHRYFPNPTAILALLAVDPLAALLCVEVNVMISARVSDVRAAQQLGSLLVLPFAGIYVASEVGALVLTPTNLALLAGALTLAAVALGGLTRATFRREEILTRWS